MDREAMTATQAMARSRNPEDVARRWRMYLADIAPIQKRIADIYANTGPAYFFVLHPDGTSTDLSGPPDDWLSEDQRITVGLLREQVWAIARAYFGDDAMCVAVTGT